MNRRTLFAGVGAGALVLAILAAGGVAFAVMRGQNPPDDSGSSPASSTQAPSTPATLAPTQSAQVGTLPIAERLRPWQADDRLVTEQELRDFHATLPTANVAPVGFEMLLRTNLYAVACMKKAGFYWDPRMDYRYRPDIDLRHADPAARVALYGNPQPSDQYNWKLGGCDGIGAHLTGSDGGPGVAGTVIPGYSGTGPTG